MRNSRFSRDNHLQPSTVGEIKELSTSGTNHEIDAQLANFRQTAFRNEIHAEANRLFCRAGGAAAGDERGDESYGRDRLPHLTEDLRNCSNDLIELLAAEFRKNRNAQRLLREHVR